jgi:hypothetical protein
MSAYLSEFFNVALVAASGFENGGSGCHLSERPVAPLLHGVYLGMELSGLFDQLFNFWVCFGLGVE